ncbi:hypothetical protein BT63DRAFT_425413 [Microthyrium microscopicum]|uniref:Protein kinase domain-containing protein n=1 Tax=Microthyrium microscopicum TaxID=703497 RepID=A0A6A6UF65_9PEZI|nr:hypothetical protein BT63DRAFT_425413 [Microthyrium microscopicum]
MSRNPNEKLKNEAIAEMDKHLLGLYRKDSYFPSEKLDDFVNHDTIKHALPNATNVLTDWIVKQARRTFLITLFALSDPIDLFWAVNCFRKHGFDDSCLPIQNITASETFSQKAHCIRDWANDEFMSDCLLCDGTSSRTLINEVQCICNHSQQLYAFHHECWSLSSVRSFYQEQWHFCLQRFELDVFEPRSIEDDRILPFVLKDSATRRIGGFSEVVQASIPSEFVTNHASEDMNSRNPGRLEIAVKTLKRLPDRSYDIEAEWRREAMANKNINCLGHANIVKCLGAFRQRDEYHLVFEWADSGSLINYWEQNRHPEVNRSNLKEFLLQLRGIADALYQMHNTAIPPRDTRRSQKDSYNDSAIPVIQIDQETHGFPSINIDASEHSLHGNAGDENWRHGDLKPENILVFSPIDQWPGTWKLADFGRAKRHKATTAQRQEVTVERWATRRYEPPDLIIGDGSRSISRLYDIWSLGCVFFEAVIWLLYGYQEVDGLGRTTGGMSVEESPYWTRRGRDGATVSQLISFWMSNIRRKDPDCAENTALGDLLSLVQAKMLVIQLPSDSTEKPGRGYRANVREILKDLDLIIHKADANETYLLTGRPRHNITAPSSGKEFHQNAHPVVIDPIPVESPPRKAKSIYEDLSRNSHVTSHLNTQATYDTVTHISGREISSSDNEITLTLPRWNNFSLIATRMTEEYRHTLGETWFYNDDNAFVQCSLEAIFKDATGGPNDIFPLQSSLLCKECSQFDPICPESYGRRLMSQVRATARRCEFCKLLVQVAQRAGLLMTNPLYLRRQGGLLKINNRSDMALRVCRSAGQRIDSQAYSTPGNELPVGLPILPYPGEELHALILRQWLNECDQHGCVPEQPLGYCPKRLLFVGDELGHPKCRIVETESLGDQRTDLKYIALSHPWGKPEEHEHFKATRRNLPLLLNDIDVNDLPANFLDAITVCMAVGISYLWIDSICILQAADGDEGDFRDEAEHIQDIYSSAYCVIAASSADGTCSGFLTPRNEARLVTLSPIATEGSQRARFYVSDLLDDFQTDVLKSPLSERGWVLQERALARRTMFFTDKQTYFECGKGIRCETLSKLQSDEASFLGDSNFPSYGTRNMKIGAQLFLMTSLFEQYSGLKFTFPPDKPIAISGMEQQLTKNFGIRSCAGVFENHSGMWLLWERASSVDRISRIVFPETNNTSTPPSWSFMSYEGAVSYIAPPSYQISWNRIRLTLPGDGKTLWMYAPEKPAMTARILMLGVEEVEQVKSILNKKLTHAERCQGDTYITFDDPRTLTSIPHTYVILGTFGNTDDPAARHYVLAVQLTDHLAGRPVYERVGVGWLPNWLLDATVESFAFYSIL